jgi:hypothetical protein
VKRSQNVREVSFNHRHGPFEQSGEKKMSQQSIVRVSLLAVCVASTALAQNSSALAGAHPGWAQVPGALIRPDCVHEIPSGAKVVIRGDQVTGDVTLNGVPVGHFDACPEAPVSTRHQATQAPTLNGWIEAVQTEVKSGGNISEINTNWTVPSNPQTNGGLIYIFDALEPSSENWILQPVLQYGNNGSFGGNYWVMSSWLVGSNGYVYHSTPEEVWPNDTLVGYVYITGISGSTLDWKVFAWDATSGATSSFSATSSGLQWNWAYAGVLEGYNIGSCSELPVGGETIFQSVVYQGYPTFTFAPTSWYGAIYATGSPSCGYSASPAGSNQVLYY